MKTVGIIFSASLTTLDPLKRVKKKRPVYIELLRRCEEKGWKAFVVTKKTYKGNGIFIGCWKLKEDDTFQEIDAEITVDLVYDRTGGLQFPIKNDVLTVVDSREFKHLAYDKWQQYILLSEYMSKSILVNKDDFADQLDELHSDWVVLKPTNGLKGLGIFIGPKSEAMQFQFPDMYTHYIVQEFIDTSHGIPNITDRTHDLRIVIINGKPVWSHVRIPPEGGYKANVSGQNGGALLEIPVSSIPSSVMTIVDEIALIFSEKYDNPIYSLDFGIDQKGEPWIFEINDQIGFPTPEMEAKDLFLEEMVKNFEEKLEV